MRLLAGLEAPKSNTCASAPELCFRGGKEHSLSHYQQVSTNLCCCNTMQTSPNKASLFRFFIAAIIQVQLKTNCMHCFHKGTKGGPFRKPYISRWPDGPVLKLLCLRRQCPMWTPYKCQSARTCTWEAILARSCSCTRSAAPHATH